jgi:hypothetical protein
MPSKPSLPGPNPTTPVEKQTRSLKAATPNTDAGRAGSAGGIVLEKEKESKSKATPNSKPAPTTTEDAANEAAKSTPRRKPRKLNKDPVSMTPASASKETALVEIPSANEIEALKSRVRGLEAKVEELYKSGSLDRPGRSPRRRGKGRKASSQQQVPTLSTTKPTVDEDDDVEEIGRGDGGDDAEEEGVEQLVRLEGELEVARQDLAAFRPRGKRTSSAQTKVEEEEDIEEISRDESGTSTANGRHVTLSGSYRIPLPASVSVDDVKHIQSGVSAAQNVARSFLEQRRAAASINSSPKPSTSSSQNTLKATKKPARPTPKSVSSSMEVIPAEDADGKKSWSEWIGGYSVAISRAVKNMEHEAAVESQRAGAGSMSASGGAKKKAIQGTGKRPGVKTKMSGEQVDELMS